MSTHYQGLAARQLRSLACITILLGLILIPGHAAAGTTLIPMEDEGGDTSLYVPGDPESVVSRLFADVLSHRTPGVCPLLMAAAAIAHTPHGDYTGPAGFEEYVATAWSAFPDARFLIDDIAAGTDHVTVRYTMVGRHLGEFGSYQPTGAVVRLEGVAILHFQNGMIAESWLQYDRTTLVEQIEASQQAPTICPPCALP